MKRRGVLVWVVALAAMLAGTPRAVRGADDGVTDQEVLAAIKKGVDYLIKEKNNNNWEEPGKNWIRDKQVGGDTSLVLYALLHVGESLEDDRLIPRSKDLAPVIEWLTKAEIRETYSASLAAAALSRLKARSPEVSATMERLRMFLVASMGNAGGYDYGHPKNTPMGIRVEAGQAWARVLATYKQAQAEKNADAVKRWEPLVRMAEANYVRADANVRTAGAKPIGDLSNAQYGTLGAWALTDAGFEMPNAYWAVQDKFWRMSQKEMGSWPYHPMTGENQRPTMGLAGIASLFITQEFVDTEVRLDPRPDLQISRGLKWLNTDFRPDAGNLYYMYGVERIGLASGLKFFNDKNWYAEGARAIIDKQNGDGSWKYHDSNNVGTAYALLFLTRGRNPVLFNKLEYEGPWNARPRDNANLTDWISKKFEKPINWQTVNLKVPAEDWMDAPVLMITGSRALTLGPADIAKIKTYIEAGGIVFSTADGEKSEFTESIKAIASKVVEENGKAKYEFKELPPEDVLFSLKNELWAKIDKPPKVLGMSNGVREIWIHSTVDMGASWQGRRMAATENFDFPANLYRYVSGKLPLRTKLQTLEVAKGNTSKTMTLARVDHVGNWDPEPGAWARMAKLMAVDAHVDLTLKKVKLGELDFKTTPVAHMTGTTRFPANDADVAVLKKFLADGGTLLADAAGGSAEFKESFEALVAKALPKGAALAEIPLTSKIYNGSIGGAANVTGVGYRLSLRMKGGAKNVPQLRGALVNGRYAVIVSDQDITSGLLGTNTWGILGYSPESAQAGARNMLLYASNPTEGRDGPGVGTPIVVVDPK